MTDETADATAARERLTEEARATASTLLDWLSTRTAAPADGSDRPPQSAGPCTWCPVCAVVAALRGEQPELTARVTEQASGLMTLLRLMVQAHQGPGHGHAHPGHDQYGHDHSGPTPDGRPAGRGAWDGRVTRPGDLEADLAAEGLADPAPAPEAAHGKSAASTGTNAPLAVDPDDLGLDATPAAEPPTRPRGRAAPVRRASPRSAAFRPAPAPAPAPVPRPVAPPEPAVTEPTPPAPTPPTRPAPRTPAGAARPPVQRIAIRRPARAGTEGEASRPDRDEPC